MMEQKVKLSHHTFTLQASRLIYMPNEQLLVETGERLDERPAAQCMILASENCHSS